MSATLDDVEATETLETGYVRLPDTEDGDGFRSVLTDDVAIDTGQAGGDDHHERDRRQPNGRRIAAVRMTRLHADIRTEVSG